MINIKSYSKAKNSDGSASGGVSKTSTIAINSVATAQKLAQTHTIWGNEFNGTQDVEGDLTIKDANLNVGGTATISGATTCDSNLNVGGDINGSGNISAALGLSAGGSLNVTGDSTLNGTATVGKTLEVKGNTTLDKQLSVLGITNLKNNLNVSGDTTLSSNLTVKGSSNLNSLSVNNDTNLNKLEVANKSKFNDDATFNKDVTVMGTTYLNNLEVTGEAHFFNLIIDEVKSVGGQIVVSCANGQIQELSGKPKYTASGIEEDFHLEFYDADGNQLVDPVDITELRIVRGSGGNDAATWKSFLDAVISNTDGHINDDNTYFLDADVWTQQAYTDNVSYISCYYGDYDTWTLQEMTRSMSLNNALSEAMADTYYYGNALDANLLTNISEYKSSQKVDYATCQRVKWKTETANQFLKGDQILCHKFSVDSTGNVTATSKHYWTLCMASGQMGEYNYVDLLLEFSQNGTVVNRINGGKVNPEVDDYIVQLGNAFDKSRQNAIVLSAYAENVLDARQNATDALKPPYIAQYQGINDYTLVNHVNTYFSRDKNKIEGELRVISDGKSQSVTEYVDNAVSGGKMYVYTAFCNNATTGNDFTINPQPSIQYNYMSVITSTSKTQPSEFKDYKDWFHISGTKTDITQYRLLPLYTEASVNSGQTLGISLQYQVLAIQGVGATTITSIPSHSISIRCKGEGEYHSLTVNDEYFECEYAEDYVDILAVSVELLIDNKVIATDTVTVTVEPGAYFEVTDKIKGLVTDIDDNKALIEANANAIKTEVTNRENAISTINQSVNNLSLTVKENTDRIGKVEVTATNINLTVGKIDEKVDANKTETDKTLDGYKQGLLDTGINIEDKTITITTDKFNLQNNEGEKVLNVDREGNLELTGIVKPKNLQLETVKFSPYPTDDANLKTDDIMVGYKQKTASTTLFKATVKISENYMLSSISFSPFCLDNTGKCKVTVEPTKDLGTMDMSFYDANGEELADPDDIYELRITRNNLSTNDCSWLTYFKWVVSQIENASITETDTGIEVMLDPEVTATIKTSDTSVSFYYYDGNYETWNFNYYDAFEYADTQLEEYLKDISIESESYDVPRAHEMIHHTDNAGKEYTHKWSYIMKTVKDFTITVTVDNDGTKIYGLTGLQLTFFNNSSSETLVTYNINKQHINSFSPYYLDETGKPTTTKDPKVKSLKIDLNNLSATYVSYAINEGLHRFIMKYNTTFVNNNDQLFYYYQLSNYLSGYYDITNGVRGGEIGHYDVNGNWIVDYSDKTNEDEDKDIAAVILLPPVNEKYRNEYLGIEMTFLTFLGNNCYLASTIDGTPVSAMGSSQMTDYKDAFDENTTVFATSKFYDFVNGGIIKVLCMPNGAESTQWLAYKTNVG